MQLYGKLTLLLSFIAHDPGPGPVVNKSITSYTQYCTIRFDVVSLAFKFPYINANYVRIPQGTYPTKFFRIKQKALWIPNSNKIENMNAIFRMQWVPAVLLYTVPMF